MSKAAPQAYRSAAHVTCAQAGYCGRRCIGTQVGPR